MKAGRTCYLLSGGGNDFLALVEPTVTPGASTIRAWCTRGLSLGADGLFTLTQSDGGARMKYFNADGAAADLCLNGTRCAVRLAAELGWHEGTTDIETDAGVFSASLLGDIVRLEHHAPPPPVEEKEITTTDGTVCKGWFLEVGVPQFVLPWPESLGGAPVTKLGAELRCHPAFGRAGTNVMFIRFLPPSRCEMRSYERGVEAETLACGTGIVAAAVVAHRTGLAQVPLTVLTGGGFEFEADVRSHTWSLSGEARLLGRIEIADEAERLPSPPNWT